MDLIPGTFTTAKLVEPHEIVSVKLVGGQLEIVRRYPSNTMLASIPPQMKPDRVVKEIYGSTPDGSVGLLRTIEGAHVPARTIAEDFVFPEEVKS